MTAQNMSGTPRQMREVIGGLAAFCDRNLDGDGRLPWHGGEEVGKRKHPLSGCKPP